MLPVRYSKLYNDQMFEWSDLRHFLAVARGGSTLAAARALRVSQPTVVRRIAALEEALGISLFERRPSGYTLTEAGEALLDRAKKVETAAESVKEGALAQARDIAGTVRISLFEIFGVSIVTPLLRELRDAHPQIRIDLDLSDSVRDLQAGEADMALRSGIQLSGQSLVCRKVCEERWGYYCSSSYLEAHDLPTTPEMLRDHPIIGDGTEDYWPAFAEWRRAAGISNSSNYLGSAPALLAAVKNGVGIGLLPHLAARADRDLILCVDGPETGHALWLVTTERLRRAPRVRLVMDFLARRIGEIARSTA